MNIATEPNRLSIFKLMTDEALDRAVAELERRLDRLDSATWPGANQERSDILDRLDQARAEQERRRT